MIARRLLPATGLAIAVSHAGCRPPPPALVLTTVEQDAGVVSAGKPARLSFPVRNEGGSPLNLEVERGCGCLVLDYERALAPGRETTVQVELDTGHPSISSQQGPVSKTLTVRSNDPKHPTATLTVRAVVRPAVYAWPGLRVAGKQASDGSQTATVRIVPTHGAFSDAPSVGTLPPGVTVQVSPWSGVMELPGGTRGAAAVRGYSLDFLVSPRTAAERRFVLAPVRTGHADQPQISLMIGTSPSFFSDFQPEGSPAGFPPAAAPLATAERGSHETP